jgi:hypothetical protein
VARACDLSITLDHSDAHDLSVASSLSVTLGLSVTPDLSDTCDLPLAFGLSGALDHSFTLSTRMVPFEQHIATRSPFCASRFAHTEAEVPLVSN